MKNIIILFLLVSCIDVSFSQVAVGLKYDINGMPFEGYYDALTYKATNKITFMNTNSIFEIGHYYDAFGHKHEGLIQFDNNKFFFKKYENDSKTKLKAIDVISLVIGVDSFFAINNFFIGHKFKEKDEFVQFISKSKGYTFVKYYQKKSKLAQEFGNQSAYQEIYFAKDKQSSQWDSFATDSFKFKLLNYFGDIPLIKSRIYEKDFAKDDIFSLIKMAEYYEKFNNSELILYNKYWQETLDVSNYLYSAKVMKITNSTWTLDYYRDSIKIYQINYSSFFPSIKTGDFICYLPNGDVRKIIKYDDNQEREVKLFNNNKLIKHFVISGDVGEAVTDRTLSVNYKIVNDTSGRNVLMNNVNSIVFVYDSIFNVNYFNEFVSDKLKTAFRIFENDTVFQITNPSYDYNLDKLQVRFNDHLKYRDYSIAESENAQGTILVSVIIDKKGYVINASILNKIHPELDFIVKSFVENILLGKYGSGLKFKPIKKSGEKRSFEIVIPFEFSNNQFYRPPANFYPYRWHWHWHNNMIHQQQFINNIKSPTFPSNY